MSTALLVIDVQRGLFDAEPRPFEADAVGTDPWRFARGLHVESRDAIDTTTRPAAALGYRVTLAADAHTTHDKPHATGAQIRAHENATLSDLTSFGPTIAAVPSQAITF